MFETVDGVTVYEYGGCLPVLGLNIKEENGKCYVQMYNGAWKYFTVADYLIIKDKQCLFVLNGYIRILEGEYA